METQFIQHLTRVTRIGDGRVGLVKDIEGLRVNVIWDDDSTREWQYVGDLRSLAR